MRRHLHVANDFDVAEARAVMESMARHPAGKRSLVFENETWRVIEEFPNYLVSNYGRIKHEDRNEPRKAQVNDKGFPTVLLSVHSSSTRYLRQVNKLVALAFLPPPTDQRMNSVWHIDGDLTNCRSENLRWDTRPRVLEWNEMNRTHEPRYKTPAIRNNWTGKTYENALECGMAEGEVESRILWMIESQAVSLEDDNAKYRYVFKEGNA